MGVPFLLMIDTDIAIILRSLDIALDVYEKQPRPLGATDLSVKSMLSVLRNQILGQMDGVRTGPDRDLDQYQLK